MHTPKVLGRQDTDAVSGEKPDARASTTLVKEVRLPFEGGAVGEVRVVVFRSVDNEDRGGLVIRITIADSGSSFIPHAELLSDGIELHVAGDIESKTVAAALVSALM